MIEFSRGRDVIVCQITLITFSLTRRHKDAVAMTVSTVSIVTRAADCRCFCNEAVWRAIDNTSYDDASCRRRSTSANNWPDFNAKCSRRQRPAAALKAFDLGHSVQWQRDTPVLRRSNPHQLITDDDAAAAAAHGRRRLLEITVGRFPFFSARFSFPSLIFLQFSPFSFHPLFSPALLGFLLSSSLFINLANWSAPS